MNIILISTVGSESQPVTMLFKPLRQHKEAELETFFVPVIDPIFFVFDAAVRIIRRSAHRTGLMNPETPSYHPIIPFQSKA